MSTDFQIVASMNTAFNNFKGDIQNIDFPRIHKQCKSIKDEIKELMTAVSTTDDGKYPSMYHTVDALCDVPVFGYGAMHLMGLDEAVFANIMANVNPKNTVTRSDLEVIHAGQDKYTTIHNVRHILFAIYHRIDNACILEQPAAIQESVAEVIVSCNTIHSWLDRNVHRDMSAVIAGVMTRFVKSEDDKALTYAVHNAKHKKNGGAGELQVYYQNEYPAMIMKSACDQPDAPEHKFLKSASFTEPVFVGV